MEGYDPRLGRQLFDRITDIYMLREATGTALERRGTPASEPGWPGDAPDITALMLQQYGIAPSSNGNVTVRFGYGGPAVQATLSSNIDDMLRTPEKDPPHAAHPLVSEGFIKDLTRATYTVITPDSVQHKLLDPTAGGQGAQVGNAITQLQALTGDNHALLLLATRLANQNVQAGVQQALMSQQSPIRLDDGTPGRLLGEEHNHYTFASDGEGGLILSVDYRLTDANFFLPAPRSANDGVGTPVTLNAGQSQAQVKFAVHIGADLAVRVHEPMQYTYDAVRAP